MRVDGKVAIVTGATTGIGEGCARSLAAAGASVLLTGRKPELGESIAADIRAAGGRARFHRLDVTDEPQWPEATAAAAEAFGGTVDILVNNAGVGRPAPLIETTLEHWRDLMSVNVEAMFLGMKHTIPLMQKSGGGSIVNISSTAGIKAFANMGAYCASKAAVNHLTKSAALEYADQNIRVNSILPGIIRTPAYDNFPGVNVDELAKATVPLAYVGEPHDIASAVLYLASDEGRYVTGAELVIDGAQRLA